MALRAADAGAPQSRRQSSFVIEFSSSETTSQQIQQQDTHEQENQLPENGDVTGSLSEAANQLSQLLVNESTKSSVKTGRNSTTLKTSKQRLSVAVKPGKLQTTIGAGKSRNAGGQALPSVASTPTPAPAPSSRLSFSRLTSSSRGQKPEERHPVELGVVGSRHGSRAGSPTSWTAQSRPTSPSELIVAVEKVKKVPIDDDGKRKARMIKSAGAKLAAEEICKALKSGKIGESVTSSAASRDTVKPQDFTLLRARAENLATLVQAKIVAAKWRAMNSTKKIDTVEAAKLITRADLHSAPLPRQKLVDRRLHTKCAPLTILKGLLIYCSLYCSQPPANSSTF